MIDLASTYDGPRRELEEINLEQRHVVCPTHAEPFRATWPLGRGALDLIAARALESPMLQTGARDPAFWKHADLVWGDLPTSVGVAMVRVQLEDRPCCEWVPPRELLGIYLNSGIGRQGICRVCGIARPGTPYGVVSGRGHDVLAHACFVCVATGRIRT